MQGKLVGNVFEFYATLGVPIIYMLGLWLIAQSGEMPGGSMGQGVGIVAAIVGIGMWVASYISLGAHFGVLPRTQKRVKTGMYKWHKHPMYVGIMLTYVGLSLANESSVGLAYSVFVMLPLLLVRARVEEKKLES